MNKILSYLLKEYDPNDTEIYLKAKFILITTLVVIFAVSTILIYTSYLAGEYNYVVMIEFFGFSVMLAALFTLVRGKYNVAIHIILIAGFATVWGVLFVESDGSLVVKMDTIVFIVALLAAMPLMFFKSRKPMTVYFIVNILLFCLFTYQLYQSDKLTRMEVLDYFFDNLMVMVFVFFISFNLFYIYSQVFSSLKKELEDRKKAQRNLKESEKKYRYLFDHAPAGMYEIDFTENKFTDVNDIFVKYTGYSRKELLSVDPYSLLTPESRKLFDERFEKLVRGEDIPNEFEYEILGKQGQKLNVILNNHYVYENNQLKGARVVAHDITERKKIEKMIIQSEKMMSVGGLAAGMAHEINNPLAGMMQNAQVIRNRLTQDLDINRKAAAELGIDMETINKFMENREILKQLDNINAAGIQASKIIDNMLSFAKKSDSNRGKHRLEELIDKTIELAESDYNLKKNYDFRQIRIIREYQTDVPPVWCEASKIQQVFFNIIKNASEAMREDPGNKAPEMIFRLNRYSETMVGIEVEDNGPGIEKETQKRIFEPFFTTKPVDRGTGLGLSVSYFIIVNDHKGKIDVESGPGKGTLFTIKLPIETEFSI